MIEHIAIFFRLPFEKKVYKILYSNGNIKSGTCFKLPHYDFLAVLNINEYARDMSKNELPDALFDLNMAKKIVMGRSKSDFKDEKAPWEGIEFIGHNFNDKNLFKKIRAIENSEFGSFKDWLVSLDKDWKIQLLQAIQKEYEELEAELSKIGMITFFKECEMRLYHSFLLSSFEGVLVDQEKVKKKCYELDSRYYCAVHELETKYHYFVSSYRQIHSISDIKDYTKNIDYDLFSKKYFWDSVEQFKHLNDFLELIFAEHYIKRDLSELLRIGNGISSYCRLQYEIVGTVTGRILVSRPGIQYLKKSSRDIFIPSSDHVFIYADYTQFEPGILAAVSNDAQLIDDYNKGDVYSAVRDEIGDPCTRKMAKEIFLSFIYGMSLENILKNIESRFSNAASKLIENFLNKYLTVIHWKDEISELAIKNRSIRGVTGYIRYFVNGEKDYEIRKLAPNHVIQSTASGIFKEALVTYLNSNGKGRLLVPMHDAILIEVEENREEEEKKLIKDCMINTFNKYCPQIKCNVHFENFYEE
jgi:DNA polymerase I-like protein with 3'-5' exonuclease and polymerase domains